MAIGPEQLDIRKLAKLFLLKGDLANALDKEILKEVLRSFDTSDWDGIRENIGETAFKRDLREAINYCNKRLDEIDKKIGTVNNTYPRYAFDVLEKAIAIAIKISSDPYLYANLKEGELETYLRDTGESLRELAQRVFLMENERLDFDSTIIGSKPEENICLSYKPVSSPVYKWQPAKKLVAKTLDGVRLDVIVSPQELPASFNENIEHEYIHVDGIYLKDAETNRRVIITRQETYSANSGDLLSLLDFGDVEIIPGNIINDMLIIESSVTVCGHENAELAAVASSYLGRPINPIPVSFGAGGNNISYDGEFEGLLKYALGIEGKNFSTLKGSPLMKKLGLEIDTAKGINPFKKSDAVVRGDRRVLSAKVEINGKHILVDNRNKVITGVGSADLNQILVCNTNAEIELPITSEMSGVVTVDLIGGENKEGIRKTDTYIVIPEQVLVDQQEDLDDINGKVYSLYPSAHSTHYYWVPAALVRNVFISLEPPVDGEYKLYSENDSMIHVAGFIIGDRLFTRYNRRELEELGIVKYNIEKELENIKPIEGETSEEYDRQKAALELENLSRPYEYKELAYYNGHIFASEEVINENNGKTLQEVKEYLKHLQIFKKERASLEKAVVVSEFIPVTVKRDDDTVVETGSYYWLGYEEDIINLPNTIEENKRYLNIVAFKTKPRQKTKTIKK